MREVRMFVLVLIEAQKAKESSDWSRAWVHSGTLVDAYCQAVVPQRLRAGTAKWRRCYSPHLLSELRGRYQAAADGAATDGFVERRGGPRRDGSGGRLSDDLRVTNAGVQAVRTMLGSEARAEPSSHANSASD